jgi:hypothetical protein
METRKEAQRGQSLPKEYKRNGQGAKREKENGITTGRVKLGIKEKRQEKGMEEHREDCILLEGDFNGRIGKRGARNCEEEKRKSKDKFKNADGVDRRKWMGGLKGNKQGDEEGEWTYIDSRGETVVVYGTVNEETWERVEEFRIGETVESDHLEIALGSEWEGKNREGKGWGIGIIAIFNTSEQSSAFNREYGSWASEPKARTPTVRVIWKMLE